MGNIQKQQGIVKFTPPPGSSGTEDTGKFNGGFRYKGGFLIPSSNGSRYYKICYDVAIMAWTCSCPGAISTGQCKHLTACGLKGRKYGQNLADGKKYGFL